jgi:hypothetical protein
MSELLSGHQVLWEQLIFPLALPPDILYNEVAVIEARIAGGIHPHSGSHP